MIFKPWFDLMQHFSPHSKKSLKPSSIIVMSSFLTSPRRRGMSLGSRDGINAPLCKEKAENTCRKTNVVNIFYNKRKQCFLVCRLYTVYVFSFILVSILLIESLLDTMYNIRRYDVSSQTETNNIPKIMHFAHEQICHGWWDLFFCHI